MWFSHRIGWSRFGSPFSGEVPESSWPTVWTEGAKILSAKLLMSFFSVRRCQNSPQFLWFKMGSTGPPDFWLCLSIHQGWPLQYHGALPKTLEVWCSYWVIYVMYPNLNWFHGCYQSSGNIRTMSNNQWVRGDYQHCSKVNSHHQKPNKYRAHHLAVGLWINPIPWDLDANKCCTCCPCDPDKEVILLRVFNFEKHLPGTKMVPGKKHVFFG